VQGSDGTIAHRSRLQGDGRFAVPGKWRSDGLDENGIPIPKKHTGSDIIAEIGTPVLSFFKGKVSKVTGNIEDGQGFSVDITSEDGQIIAKYWHLDKDPRLDPSLVDQNTGDFKEVQLGQIIGEVGISGNAKKTDQPHLHFQLQKIDGTQVDPGGCIGAHF